MADMRAIQEAVKQLMGLVGEAEVGALRSKGAPVKVEAEISAEPEACAECEAGTCVEHAEDEDMEGVASLLK